MRSASRQEGLLSVAREKHALAVFVTPRQADGGQRGTCSDCFLGGNEALLEEDSLFFAVVSKLSELLKLKDAEIKKLYPLLVSGLRATT